MQAERRTHNKLVEDGANAPQVGLGVILVELQDLGRHVERGAAQGFSETLRLQAARKAEIRDLQQLLARLVGGQQQVLRLQVPLQHRKERSTQKRYSFRICVTDGMSAVSTQLNPLMRIW